MIKYFRFRVSRKKRMMKRASTKRERKAERMRHTARMRKNTPPKLPTWATHRPSQPLHHHKGTHETYCHIDHETDRQPLHQIFNAGWSGAEASFQILLYFSSLFHNIDFFFYCLVGGFTLLVSGGRYGRGENMQGFW